MLLAPEAYDSWLSVSVSAPLASIPRTAPCFMLLTGDDNIVARTCHVPSNKTSTRSGRCPEAWSLVTGSARQQQGVQHPHDGGPFESFWGKVWQGQVAPSGTNGGAVPGK